MKMKLLLCFNVIAAAILSTQVYAIEIPIDVYGTDSSTAEKIIKEVGPDLEEIGQYLHLKRTKNLPNDTQKEKWKAQLKKKVMDGIDRNGDFTYVRISPIFYQDLSMYITIDLIEKKDQKRLNYIPQVSFNSTKEIMNLKKDKNLNRLLQEWAVYEEKGRSLLFTGKAPIIKKCPAYHCVFGFDDPELKQYLSVFEKEVPKNKKKLITILKTDPDEERRSTAAFLLGHIKNGQELIDVLTPSMSDPSAGVRNNVMRVLGSAIDVVNPKNFDIDSVIKALDFPDETDRNKALCMIITLSNQPKYARYIAQHASAPLMALLKMKQPNLHKNTYVVLHKISKESYDARDYAAWEAWFARQAMKEEFQGKG